MAEHLVKARLVNVALAQAICLTCGWQGTRRKFKTLVENDARAHLDLVALDEALEAS